MINQENNNEEVQQMPGAIKEAAACINLESVNRITKLPMVETTLQTSRSIYEKVKDYNSLTNWTISTAENTVHRAVEVGKPYAVPMVQSLEGPIKRVDGMLCTGLDYVEAKVPAVKLPPGELYSSTKDYISNNPTVVSACSVVKPAVDTARSYVVTAGSTAKITVQGAKNMVEPALENARKTVEPAYEQAKHMVEPYIESSMERAAAIRDFGTQKFEEYMHTTSTPNENDIDGNPMAECKDLKKSD